MTLAAEIAISNVEKVPVSATVAQAAKAMQRADVGDVVVVDGDDPVGILTDRDIVVRVLAEGKSPARTKVKSVCSKNLVTIDAMGSVEEAEGLIREHAVRRLPVMDRDGRMVGIVSLDDLVRREYPDSPFAGVMAAQARP